MIWKEIESTAGESHDNVREDENGIIPFTEINNIPSFQFTRGEKDSGTNLDEITWLIMILKNIIILQSKKIETLRTE